MDGMNGTTSRTIYAVVGTETKPSSLGGNDADVDGDGPGQQWEAFSAVNGHVGCVPPVSTGIQKHNSGRGVIFAKQQNALLELKVLFGDKDSDSQYNAGDSVWVEYLETSQPYLHRAYEVEGHRFVLVPISHVRLYRAAPPTEH